MTFRLRSLLQISRVFPSLRCLHPGVNLDYTSSQLVNLPSPINAPLYINNCDMRRLTSRTGRFSTMLQVPSVSLPEVDLLAFFDSVVDEAEGPHHCWLNKLVDVKEHFNREGTFLVIAEAFLQNPLTSECENAHMLEKVKLLQRRYPWLHIFGFQSGSSICSAASQSVVVQTIMKEYITFPILLSNRSLSEVKDGAFFLIFKDFKNPLLHFEKTTELGLIAKGNKVFAIEEISLSQGEKSAMTQNGGNTEIKQMDFIKEPSLSSFRNLLLSFPGCISVDEDGNRLFLSDTNHHRIIISDVSGKILDCIGSCPGFEDGEFESAKLLRPAASFYHPHGDCLYVVDSENIAIRRADLGRRTLETIYPSKAREKFGGVWSWILEKLGMTRSTIKEEELNLESLFLPWHLMRFEENSLLVANRSFHSLWIMEMDSGIIKEVVTGYANIMERCGHVITEKVILLNQILGSRLKHGLNSKLFNRWILSPGILSSLATVHRDIIFCDTVGQTLLRLNRESEFVSNINLSNVGMLGLPYWFSFPLEKFLKDVNQRTCVDHHQCFTVLPGRCNIHVKVDVPEDTVLASMLEEGSIWRQARGSAAEVSVSDDVDASTEKVGVAQQWFDELDNLVFEEPDTETSSKENKFPEMNSQQQRRVHVPCAINISPGTSEVFCSIFLSQSPDRAHLIFSHYPLRSREEKARRLARFLDEGSENHGREACTQLMLRSNRDIEDIIFMRPLHVRLHLNCQNHPKTHKANDQILTDTTIEVNVSLD
ncbi:hypothetical protein Sjap_005890 [Stephania japonica]|uniref:NHL domain-containing protein n=1 Tax=Stephania japonica TaxID=461633 RepID=A0AAP0PJ84_9MAGN